MYKFIVLGILLMLIFVRCEESEKPFNENLELKAALMGKWKKIPDPNSSGVSESEVIFEDHTMHWYDSGVNIYSEGNGEIQTVRGQCPVKFTFRDGIQHYNPDNLKYVYSFTDINENDLLWVFILDGENSTVVSYSIVDGAITMEDTWKREPMHTYISTSFVRLTNDGKTAEFCYPGSGVFASPITKSIRSIFKKTAGSL